MIETVIPLGVAYYMQGFVNIRVAYNEYFGQHNEHLRVFLGSWDNAFINSRINRQANRNHTPRIMMGVVYTRWMQANHNLGDNVMVSFNNPLYPNSILIQ